MAKDYYISLTRGLCGYYVHVLADDEHVAREYASNYFSNNWCSIYTFEDLQRFRKKAYKTAIINPDDPVVLGSSGSYE